MLRVKHAKVFPMPIEWQDCSHTVTRINFQVSLLRKWQLQKLFIPVKAPFNVHVRKQQRLVSEMTLSEQITFTNYSTTNFLYGHTALWNGGISCCLDCMSKTSTIVLHPGFRRRTSPLYFSARISCSFNSGWYEFNEELLSLLLFPDAFCNFCSLMLSSSIRLKS